ncbi:hypothetical protein RCIP0075_00018 [Klebsiella phage RCIP0075]
MNRFNIRHYVNTCAIALLLLVGMSSCDPAHAQARKVFPIETHTAQPGMTLEDFAKAIRKRVSRLGHRESAEVCGAFYQRDGVYGVKLVTSGREMECVMDTPADFTGVTIHTHPVTSPGLFSEHDYAAGEGYLVLKGVLYHQRGKGTARRVL